MLKKKSIPTVKKEHPEAETVRSPVISRTPSTCPPHSPPSLLAKQTNTQVIQSSILESLSPTVHHLPTRPQSPYNSSGCSPPSSSSLKPTPPLATPSITRSNTSLRSPITPERSPSSPIITTPQRVPSPPPPSEPPSPHPPSKLKTVKLLPPLQHQKPEKKRRNDNTKKIEVKKKNVSTIRNYFESKTNSESNINCSSISSKKVNLMLENLSDNSVVTIAKTGVACKNISACFSSQPTTSPRRRQASRTSSKIESHATSSLESREQLQGFESRVARGTGYGAQIKRD